MPNTSDNQFSFVPPMQGQQLTPDQAMSLATQLQSQGRLQESEHWLQQILQLQPNHAFALHLLGVIAHQVGKQALAAELMQKAIRSNGSAPLFHANLCEVLRQLKRLDEAITHGERAVTLEPKMVMAHSKPASHHPSPSSWKAASTSASWAPARPRRTFSARVVSKRKPSCGTMRIAS